MKDLSQHILDLAENAISAGATLVEIRLENDQKTRLTILELSDNGHGMDSEKLAKVIDPFFTTRITRKVGLGLSLVKLNAERTGGSFSLESNPGKGTLVIARFRNDHPDFLPEGDIPGTIIILATANPTIEFNFTYITNKGSYTFSTSEVKAILEEIELSNPAIYQSLKELVANNLHELKIDYELSQS
jgi:hypothetical protein